ncbi:Sodium pump decarboxylase, gamma subunit [Shewanella piezotolerans WP3]|uniref:Probable oxaloacetate decarboxylase gamma chain n=1 Tax=Shewanella piezotolerans (strain WP3 / JCM 13877) TaxID=225849 RepID=B8CJR8_SHEPW|nr:OadG family transporter subunit [Shewanella piezotolerans]ACJ28165.1 Sodium pump decarboxylase, gamma subunit [Shewanella piezotolerans WP3]
MEAISEQLTDALGIMILGMCLVFVFLSVLILAMKLVAKKYAPEPQEKNCSNALQPIASKPTVSPLMAAVIASAIHQHRQKA